MGKITIYTDGAVFPNPGRSSLSFYVEQTEHKHYEPIELATNNQAELLAIREALKHAAEHHKDALVTIYCDNEWAVRSISGVYKSKKNIELIREIQSMMQPLKVIVRWCRAHCGIEGNEIADSLATQGLKEAIERWGEYTRDASI